MARSWRQTFLRPAFSSILRLLMRVSFSMPQRRRLRVEAVKRHSPRDTLEFTPCTNIRIDWAITHERVGRSEQRLT